jgi:PAS domain S-box-containing protein
MSAHAHSICRRWSLALGAAILLAPLAAPGQNRENPGASAPVQPGAPGRSQILVLDSFQYGSPVADSVNRGIVTALTEGGFSINDIFVEGLDLVRRPDSQHRLSEAVLLRQKLASNQIPIIIVEGALARTFMAEEGSNFFPSAALLAVLNAGVTPGSRDNSRKVMDMSEQPDLSGTVRAALDLFPRTRRVFVVIGGRPDIFPFLDRANREFAAWTNRLDFEYTSQMTYAEIMRRVSTLPPDSIILYTPFFSDASGRTFIAFEVLDHIQQTASVPIFATLESYMGHGIVGGSLVRTEAIGRQAGKVALDYLNGRIPLVEPVTTFDTPSAMIFDWRELLRWKADLARLPKDSILIGRPSTLWGQYKGEVIAAVVVVLALSGLVFALLFLNRRLKRTEIAALDSEARFRVMVEHAPEAIIVFDMDARRIVDANPKAEQLLGCKREKLLQSELERFLPSPQPDASNPADGIRNHSQRAIAGEEVVLEHSVRTEDARELTCEVRMVRLPYRDLRLLRASFIDITGRKRAEAAIRASLDEKTVLLKEVHHRVKNNLQIVSSLLSLQAGRMPHSPALDRLLDTQNRVRSMALIHETLYRSQNLARVNFAAYVDNLCTHLLRAFAVDPARVQFVSHVPAAGLELDEALLCGLIINELVSNALKHAFPARRPGRITLEMQIETAGRRTLRVADDGVGLPAGLDPNHTDTLGLQLVANLADQLGATLQLERLGGTAFQLTFQAPMPLNHDRHVDSKP